MKDHERARTPNGTRWHLVRIGTYTALCGVALGPESTREPDDGSRGSFCRACIVTPDTDRIQKPKPTA